MGFNPYLLTWRIWRATNNAKRWQMGFNSAFKELKLILLTWRIWRANNSSRWQMGFNPYPAKVENMVSS
jgi:hypothetical protein